MRAPKIVCDYLVVGAGAASLSFIDTLLTELPKTTKIVLIDRKEAPGGHWLDAYGYVQLHQPSLLYGMASRQLEGSWLRLVLQKWIWPWQHRATKTEILQHFDEFVKDKIASKQLIFYPKCDYDFSQQETADGTHTFTSCDGSMQYQVQVNVKLVNGTLGECIIPSQTPPSFQVGQGIHVVPPNTIFDQHKQGVLNQNKKYVVIGAGKTAMDTIVYLQKQAKVRPENISWVISQDVWMLARWGNGSPWSWPKALLECKGNHQEAALKLEREGKFVRLDKNVMPKVCRFPLIGKSEFDSLQKVDNIARQGRVSSIQMEQEKPVVRFNDPDQEPWRLTEAANNVTFVHCTSPGPFNGKQGNELFFSERSMGLYLLYAPPVSISMSCLAMLEAARQKKTLDLEFGRQLVRALQQSEKIPEQHRQLEITENDVLRNLVKSLSLTPEKGPDLFTSLVNIGVFLCLVDKDPLVGLKWLKQNRLSFFSVPGFKGRVYETIVELRESGDELGYSNAELQMFELLQEKLKPLEGQ